VIVNYPSHGHTPHLPWVPASAYVVADAGTGQVLAARDPHGKFLPASTLKVLTAVALMPVLSPDRKVPTSTWAAGTEPSKVGLIAGRWYRVSDLFKALLMISANDAAVALAQGTGSYHKGMAIINAEAHHLRADDTVARRPNGLDARGQHVSAYDEALFARAALALPQFMRDEALRTARFPLRRHHSITLYSQNTMMDTFPGDLGGKIGWTTAAGATFIGWARRHGHTLVVTILHCTPLAELDAAARLLKWGFAVDGKIGPVGRLASPTPVGTSRPRARTRQPSRRVTARVVASRSPVKPIAAGAGTFVAALLLGCGITAAVRRSRGAGARRARLPQP
jgi:D-alanyl-D-alanine carboxypeptidase (penicillin-binding protein 5/6)